jgi:hypothetical protein
LWRRLLHPGSKVVDERGDRRLVRGVRGIGGRYSKRESLIEISELLIEQGEVLQAGVVVRSDG